ncbi:unnamed protein product [Linum tenue]|uniref:Exostosin GT47 domain-containing protein n=1 Tax=Linum tenue TaxID=586396 RepID=A0AAV0R378_9ROSI|nr:unnamed protein product [Linum tenue]
MKLPIGLSVTIPLLLVATIAFFTLSPPCLSSSSCSALSSSVAASPSTWKLSLFRLHPPHRSAAALLTAVAAAEQQQQDLPVKESSFFVNKTPVPLVKPTATKLDRMESNLARARTAIREASRLRRRGTPPDTNLTSSSYVDEYTPRGAIYRNADAFRASYTEMERLFRVYVYKEGEPPIFHDGPCRSIYSSEGRFIHEMEKGKGKNMYVTEDPDEAMVYFLPFSVVRMVQYLYEPGARETDGIGRAVLDYIGGPRATTYHPHLYNNSIRVLCNANTSEGFNPAKDASFPEIHLRTGEITGLIGGPSPSSRSILAFFAGRLHGHIRKLVLDTWKDRDQDVQVFDNLPPGVSYESKLRNSRFCLCPSGYEVASPRVVEAIYAECVPVLISDSYVPPFSDVLNWSAFSVTIGVEDIGRIKEILTEIPEERYLKMHRRVKQVQRHFVANGPPKRFDVFHMTVHSIWLRRLNVRIQNSSL